MPAAGILTLLPKEHCMLVRLQEKKVSFDPKRLFDFADEDILSAMGPGGDAFGDLFPSYLNFTARIILCGPH